MNRKKPTIGITMGDPAGIGPEITVKTLAQPEIYELCRPLLIGDRVTLQAAVKLLGYSLEVSAVEDPDSGRFEWGTIDIFDLNNIDFPHLGRGQVSAEAGKAAYEYVIKAAELAMAGKIEAIVTAPINKEALNAAHLPFTAHTEILANYCKSADVSMMLATDKLKVSHVTTHVSMRQACELVKKPRILKVIQLTHQALLKMGFSDPLIAVAGLNPHAGEGGMFGTEDVDEILPAVDEAQKLGIRVVGPIPGDTVFFRALYSEQYGEEPIEGIVVMYHDQGHIPVKLLGFFEGVNITLGLPIIRTSVDHGTAFDKAWKGTTSEESMKQAIKMAVQIATGQFSKHELMTQKSAR